MARILMCRPDHYGIEYEINPWMDCERQTDHELAMRQWTDLRTILESLGATIELLEPVKGLPDLVFTANAGLVVHDKVILSRFRHTQRQGEESHCDKWFQDQGLTVDYLPSDYYFEGAGDALFCGETLWGGYRIRSDAISQQQVAKMVGQRVLPLELVNSYFYHLDTCFCPLAADLAIWFPGAFDTYGQKVVQEQIRRRIQVAPNEAESFACNAVVVGTSVVTNEGCPDLHDQLQAEGFTPYATPLGEFVKAGGSAKCLTLRLDGEEAAPWSQNAASCSS